MVTVEQVPIKEKQAVEPKKLDQGKQEGSNCVLSSYNHPTQGLEGTGGKVRRQVVEVDKLDMQVESAHVCKKKELSPSISRLVSLFEGPEGKSMDVDKTEVVVVAGKDLSNDYMPRGRRILILIIVTRIDVIFKMCPVLPGAGVGVVKHEEFKGKYKGDVMEWVSVAKRRREE